MTNVTGTQVESARSSVFTRTHCVFCDSGNLQPVIDLGNVALAGGFLTPEQFDLEPKFPLRLFFCCDCFAVQVVDVIDADVLFKNYFYFSSAIGSLREHFTDYATEVVSRFLVPEQSTVVEFGCNDGVLLRPLADQRVRTLIGVDPATNVVNSIKDERITTINDFFGLKTAKRISGDHGKADLIVANNVFAHIPDINDATAGVKELLNDEGVFIFEVHYLGSIIQGLQYDMIYHEHLYYYSLLSLQKHFARYGMTVFDVKPIPIHAGSMRYYVAKNGSRHCRNISARVDLVVKRELDAGFDKHQAFVRFASDVAARKDKLMELLEKLVTKKRKIVGYGASGRANTIIQYCGIDHGHISSIIDDAPAKSGYYTPGSHFLIKGNEALVEDKPDYLLIFAWGYVNEIAHKCRNYLEEGGRMILPLPEVRVMLHPSPTNDSWL